MKTIRGLFTLIIGIILLIIGLIFSLSNMTPVSIKFYHFETLYMPLWLLVILSILTGACITALFVVADLFNGSQKTARLKKEIKLLKQDLESFNKGVSLKSVNVDVND